MDVSKINIPGYGGIGIKDAVARQDIDKNLPRINASLNKFSEYMYNGGKVAFFGDSICAGLGWWTTSPEIGKDGIAAVLREKYPAATVDNYGVSGATIADLAGQPHLSSQITGAPVKDYGYIFIICGINDITVVNSTDSDTMGTYYNFYEQIPTSDWSKTFPALSTALNLLQARFSESKIFLCIEPTCEANYALYEYVQAQYCRIAKFYGVGVIDMYAAFPEYKNTNTKSLFWDYVHPSEAGYRMLADFLENTVNAGQTNYYKDMTYIKMLFVDYDLTSITSQTSFYDRYKKMKELCVAINNGYKFLYSNEKFVLTDGSDVFVYCDILKDFTGINRYTFNIPIANNFPIGFKITQDSTTIVYDNRYYLSSADFLETFGVTSYKDIPISGCYVVSNTGNFSSDLPSTLTANTLIVNAYVVYQNGYYKRIEVSSIDDTKICVLMYFYNENPVINTERKFTIQGT